MDETIKLEFKGVDDVVRYLSAKGWQVSRQSFYRHLAQGKVSDKPWTDETLDAYAAEHLRPATTGAGAPVGSRPAKGMAAELLAARKKKTDIESELKELELRKARGDLVEREMFEMALSRRAIFLKSSLVNWFPRKLDDLITILEGNLVKAPDVIDLWRVFVDDLLGSYVINPRLDLGSDPAADSKFDVPVLTSSQAGEIE